jgi:hypothetical protein
MNQLTELHREVVTTRWLLQRAADDPASRSEFNAVHEDIRLVERAHLRRIQQLVEELLLSAERAGNAS